MIEQAHLISHGVLALCLAVSASGSGLFLAAAMLARKRPAPEPLRAKDRLEQKPEGVVPPVPCRGRA